MRRLLEGLGRRVWFGEEGGVAPGWRPFLMPLSAAEMIYRRGAERAMRPFVDGRRAIFAAPCPVISVGNLTVGGSGKSTLCLQLARLLRERGLAPAVISHAYRSSGRDKTLVFRGRDGRPSWRMTGDEAAMMADADPELLVVSGPDRSRAMRAAIGEGSSVLILDDAFHRRDIHRDLDLVLVDAGRGFGNGRCLPAGPLREPPAHLARADAVLFTRTSGGHLPASLSAAVPVVGGRPALFALPQLPDGLRPARGGAAPGVSVLAGRRVFAFCGLGNPAGFRRSLEALGADMAGERAFPDHHAYTRREIEGLAADARAAGAWAAVTTAKDAVKLEGWPAEAPPLMVLGVRFELGAFEGWLTDRLAALERKRDGRP